MSRFRKELAYDISAFLAFVLFYVIVYRDILFEQSLFFALNLSPPIPTSNPRFYVPGQFYWFPGSLGAPAQPNLANWLPYIFILISGGNQLLALKLLASTTLVSCFTMYFFLRNHFRGPRLARFFAAFFYGFGPATVLNFADIFHWGYAAIPIAFNYVFNIFEEKRRCKDIILLGLSLSVLTAFLPQILPLIFLSFLIFLIVHALASNEKVTYLRRMVVSFSLVTLVFIATSPYLFSGFTHLLVSMGYVSTETVTSLSLPTDIYVATYSNQEIATTIRLIGGSPGNHLSGDSWIGFLFPALAFSSLLLVRKVKNMLNLLGLALVSVVTILIIYGIHLQAVWSMWLVDYTPVRLFFYPERPLYVVTFAYSVMISVTVGGLIDIISHCRLNFDFKFLPSVRFNLKHVYSALLVSLLLTGLFLFIPLLDAKIRQERYQPLPSVYSSIQNWLSSHGGEVYRVMFLPTDSFSSVLGMPDDFAAAPGYALPQTRDYVDFTYNELIKGDLRNLGSLLSLASVKYVVLATPNASTLWSGTSALAPLLHPVWDLQGNPRYYANVVQGDPSELAALLDSQRDLKLVHFDKDFRIYENEMYMPKISVFPSALYIVGSKEVLSILPYMPGFSTFKDLPILANQNPSLARELLQASSSVLFFDTSIEDYAVLLSSSTEMQTVYEEAVNAVSLKKQLYLFVQDSPTFSKSVTCPSGEYWVAVNVPEPENVSLDMEIIDLDSAQKFVITRENFKPARNSPQWDFDLANYYFVTATGGNVSVTLKGAGAFWAYTSYNSTLTQIGHQTNIDLPDNGTFSISLPPNSGFQPMVNAYNPAIGQIVPDNLSQIVIEHQVGGDYTNVNIEGTNVTNAQTPDGNGWSVFGPVYVDSGTHSLTITNGISGSLVAVYNTANLADIFWDKPGVTYEFSKSSETSYNIRVNSDRPVFLSLSESYSPNWFAYSEGERLMHFIAFYSNALYLNRTSTNAISVKIEYEPPVLNQVYVGQQILFATLGLFLLASPITHIVRYKIKNWRKQH